MWVLQEIVLARRATFIWGAAELDWRVIKGAIDIIHGQPCLLSFLGNRALQNARIMHQLSDLQSAKRLKSEFRFLQLLGIARSFDVTEPRDKVYGLLGFPNAGTEVESSYSYFVPGDYKVPHPEVYIHVARKLLQKDQNLDFLSFALHTDPDFSEKESGIPTWVPDWNCKEIVLPFVEFDGPEGKHRAGESRGLDTCAYEGTDVLRVKGVVVDTVSASLPSGLTPELNHHKETTLLRSMIEWCMETQPRPTASVLSTTLTAGRDFNGALVKDNNDDDEQHLADFAAFLLSLDPKGFQRFWPEDASVLAELALRLGNPDTLRDKLSSYVYYRSVFRTVSGKVGLGPAAVKEGDLVVVLWGGQVPYVLRRRREGQGTYAFVGECYVEGLMRGEAGERIGEEEKSEMVFDLR
jgi:hypothetical protein